MPRRRRSPNQKYHDRVAGKYEHIYSDAYWLWHDGLTWDYLKPYLPTDLNAAIVDLGCGSGKWGRKLLKSGYRVIFLDLSAKMIDEAARHVADAGGSGRAYFVRADVMDLSALPADHFGLAVAMGEPLCAAENPARAMQQIARILAPGGHLVATFDNRVACVDHYLREGDPGALETFLKTGRTHWLTRDPGEQFALHTFEPDQLRKQLAAAGFDMLEIIGKTVLPMRQHRELLEDPAARRRWARIEKSLARDPHNLGRCPHLQIAARKTRG